MRRSICYCEPNVVLAGETNTFSFIYTPAVSLPKGTLLRFDLCSKGRIIDWQEPDANPKATENVIYALLENGKVLNAREVELSHSVVPVYDFVLSQEVKAASPITICMGAPKGKNPQKNGNCAQQTLQRRRPFQLSVDPSGKGNFQDPETFTLDIKGNVLETIRILTPSVTTKNKRFDVILRFEDAYGNLTNNAPEDTLIELSHENLRENLKWKLFVPETGFIALPNLYFNEPGVYTFKLVNVATKETFYSSPTKCFPYDVKNYFWGMLHGESERFDSTENIESCLRHFRDEKSMNFIGTSAFESAEETPNETWKLISQNVEEFNDEERFAVLLGQQWVGTPKSEGVRQIIFAKGEKAILRKKEQRASTLKKLYNSFSPKEILAIPSFTMGKGFEYDFKDFDPDFERVVEIYNAWGSSDCTEKQSNPLPIKGPTKKGISESAEGSIIQALCNNKRFGFVAGGLDDRGIYQDFYDNDQEQYAPGLTCVLSDTLSRPAIFDALYNRSCYATTGERIILGVTLANMPMGSILDTAAKPGLAICRHISGYVAGTAPIEKVELIRNGETLTTFTSNDRYFDFTYDDMEPIHEIALASQGNAPAFVFYYLRVTQEDGHMAWSSPIWIDHKGANIKFQQKAKKTEKPKSPEKPKKAEKPKTSEKAKPAKKKK